MEWKITDQLPGAFVEVINGYIRDQTRQKVSFFRIADSLGIPPSTISRWMAGMGPLTTEHLEKVSKKLGITIYLTVGLSRPTKD